MKKSKIKRKIIKKDFWETLSVAEKADINAGLADLKNGKKKIFNEVMDKYK